MFKRDPMKLFFFYFSFITLSHKLFTVCMFVNDLPEMQFGTRFCWLAQFYTFFFCPKLTKLSHLDTCRRIKDVK